jgi:hypothetical protein
LKKKSRDSPLVFSVDSFPHRLSYAEWTARWWQWLLSIPVENNPANDNSGEDCCTHQHGPVWFLAGTVGGVAGRRCTLPEGKAILFPILNYGATFADEPTIKSEQELISLVEKEMDVISNLEVVIDGEKLDGLEKYRVRSPIFEVVLPENNLFVGRPGPTRGVADGFWLFLEPLQKGRHTVESFGSCLSGKVNIGVNYRLTVGE